MNNQLSISVPVVLLKKKESKKWIAYCPVLKTYGFSTKSQEDALKDFDSAIETFFHVHHTLGTLNKTLLRFGWVRSEKKFEIPKIHSDLPPFRTRKGQTTRKINVPAFAC